MARRPQRDPSALAAAVLDVLDRINDWVAVMYLGKVVEPGTTEEIFQRPNHPYTELPMYSTPV